VEGAQGCGKEGGGEMLDQWVEGENLMVEAETGLEEVGKQSEEFVALDEVGNC